MKKFFSILIVMLLCLSLIAPVYAAEPEDSFVPSISYKPSPAFIPYVDEAGIEYIGVIRDEEGSIVDYIEPGCLIVTPIAHVWDERYDVPQEIEDFLLFLYNSLNDGSMKIPYEKHNANLDPEMMVIRDLFDARWACEEHPRMLAPKGVVMELTFDLGVVPEAQIYVQTYDEATKIWEPVVSTVNNGDGTVTCVFEHLCGIEFSMHSQRFVPVEAAHVLTPAVDQESANVLPWIIVMIVAAAAAVGIILGKKKNTAA